MSEEQQQIETILKTQKIHAERIKLLEARVPEYPKLRVPDYTSDLQMLRQSIERFLASNHQKNMDDTMLQIREIVSHIPNTINVKNHHHFAKANKRVVIAFLVLITCLAFTIWLAYYFYKH